MNIIKPEHDAGFFSVCNVDLHQIIQYYRTFSVFPILDTSLQWKWYKDSDADIYSRFFKATIENFPVEKLEEKYWYDYNNEDQFSDYSKINYNFVTPFIKKYFSFSSEVIELEKILVEKYQISQDNIISVCYRSNDKCKETNLPSYEEIEIKLNEVINNNPNKRILVQSDDLNFCNYISQRVKNTFLIEESFKINHNSSSQVSHSIPLGMRVYQAIVFLSIMSIMSKSSIIITNSGNVGLWICYFRGKFDGVHQFLCRKNENIKYWFTK